MPRIDPKFAAPKGVLDLLPPKSAVVRAATSFFGELATMWGYWPIETPGFEKTEVFERSVGGTSDIVSKQMYTFEDKSGESVTLRPEGTAGVVRAFVEHEIYKHETLPWRVFYVGDMFRYERPQAGRYRQFKQVGAEAIGVDDPAADVEQIEMCLAFLDGIGVEAPRVLLNSIGDKDCRPAYLAALGDFLASKQVASALCAQCRVRVHRNPLRVLDCKNPECRLATERAPKTIEYLCGPCGAHFDSVVSGLEALDIGYELESRLVRGLDYYVRTAFEIVSAGLHGAQDAVAGGGRYDGLAEVFGGPPTPAVGFAVGVERSLEASPWSTFLRAKTSTLSGKTPQGEVAANLGRSATVPSFGVRDASPDVVVVGVEESCRNYALSLASRFRKEGIITVISPFSRSLKSRMKYADKAGASVVVVLGPEELDKKEVAVREMSSSGAKASKQTRVPLQEAASAVKRILEKEHDRMGGSAKEGSPR